MRRLVLVLGLALPACAQWTVWDPANYGMNLKNLQQAIQDYQQFQAYAQMYRNSQAFLHNPGLFLAAATNVVTATDMVLQQRGSMSAQRVAQLQKIMTMGRIAMNEAQTIQVMSHGNSAAVGQMAIQLAQVSQQLVEAQKQLEHETRAEYYKAHSVYRPQAETIAGWRLK